MNNNVTRFAEVTTQMLNLYEVKNRNYGDSFDKSLDADGLLVSKIRIGDKVNRFGSLLKQGSTGTTDESLRDTLIDLANYTVMTIMWLDKQFIQQD